MNPETDAEVGLRGWGEGELKPLKGKLSVLNRVQAQFARLFMCFV